MTTYAATSSQYLRLADLPFVDRKGLLKAQREWIGNKVAVLYTIDRGSAHRRATRRIVYGVLVKSTNAEQVQVRTPDGAIKAIHFKRVETLWNKGS